MTQDTIVTIIQTALLNIILVSAPPLIVGLTVGVLVSIFQAVTSIQEATLAFVPKILGVLLSLIVFGPFMLSTLQELITSLFLSIPQYIVPR